jgi:site-specific recombinase XerD
MRSICYLTRRRVSASTASSTLSTAWSSSAIGRLAPSTRLFASEIVKKRSDGRIKPISPHVWRHSTAVHLLEAGVEVNVIRAWLGHASLETTNRYAEITLRTKRAALEKCTLSTSPDERIPRKPRWHTDDSLMDWLKSL